jgi:hypothetical protein
LGYRDRIKAFLEESKTFIEEKTLQAFEVCRSDPQVVRKWASGQTLGQWRAQCVAMGAAVAGGALLPGPAAIAALGLEIPALLNIFSRAALGVGWIKRGQVHAEDYNNILGVWSGAIALDETLRKSVQTQAAIAVAAAAPKLAASLSASALTTALTVTAGKKGASATMSYFAARKFATQLIGKLPARMIPLAGFCVAAVLNGWFVNSILNAAEEYYDFLGSGQRLTNDPH